MHLTFATISTNFSGR